MKSVVRSNWGKAVLICRKCSRKVDGGFGEDGRTGLAKALRAATGGGKGRKAAIGIVEVDCLKICPKHAVTIVDASRPGQWQLVRPGTPIAEVAALLGIETVG